MDQKHLEDIEIDLLLEALKNVHGYNFKDYAPASLKRRVNDLLRVSGEKNIASIIPRVLHDEDFMPHVMKSLCVHVTEMFRDPYVFLTWRRDLLPILKTHAHINIWIAGCATGEEVYSMAILLKEEGLYDRSRIYATDLSQAALDKAEEGIYPLSQMREYSRNYQDAGGRGSLADYYHARYEFAILDEKLRENILFSQHDLGVDGVFCEATAIVCRNVLIYFNMSLQDRVLQLFSDSLVRGGLLCIGTKESLRFSTVVDQFRTLGERESVYQKTALIGAKVR